ncbi:TetR/AcrR family transcriptional regulator [Streptomyces sp. NBC_00690]|uniref:TetR/AcrR family transcriptional regulator n=1 Tax=Streptomyces sp. NBC_00690 TaxID=2975808 RepID=UPI002E2BF94B|nr:TetR/AcrR family transcriptional regulator [Streptomyces sp. NBC_00690]
MSAVESVKGKRLPRAVREEQMMNAAVRTFARRGYRAASMDEIAQLAGVSKPLVYLYLNSKDQLFTACIRREAQALLAAVQSAIQPGLPADRQLWAGLTAFFAYTVDHPDGWAVLHRQARTHGEPFAREVAAMRDEIVAFVAVLIQAAATEAGEARPEPELAERDMAALAQALVGAAESLAGWMNDTGSITVKEASATLMNFAWVGLGQLLEGERWSARDAQESAAVPVCGA